MSDTVYDLAIIGGGINGCGIARDATGRGLSVFLAEQADLGGATSASSTKLIHGGLRYLEHYEFRLVREALMEREVLLRLAPHIIRPLRFVLPHHKGLRPRWMLRLGLFLYDHLGGRKILPPTSRVDLTKGPIGAALKPGYSTGFEYSDCWVEDSRLVVLNAMDAAARGAVIRPRTRCIGAERDGALWRVTLEDAVTGERTTISARGLVNAAGPWVAKLLAGAIRANTPARVRLVKGSHIVVPKLHDHDRAYIFQNSDGRIVFAIPYERDFTLIGTTDRDYDGDPAQVAISDEEIAYLCAAASEYFRNPVTPDQVVWTYSGVRPLYDDGASKAQEATRDYVLELDAPETAPPLLTIFGGKITTYRRLAESVLEKLAPFFQMSAPWTDTPPLPGGDFPYDGSTALVEGLVAERPFLGHALALRLVRAYGTRVHLLLRGVSGVEDLGQRFGSDLTEAEVRYLMDHEWARTAQDVLWRRSKLGLRLSKDEAAKLERFMAEAGQAIARPQPVAG